MVCLSLDKLSFEILKNHLLVVAGFDRKTIQCQIYSKKSLL